MDDIFDDILDLEGDFYTEGYDQGWADGLISGRVEGRSLGMQKGFDKFFEAGRMHGRSLVWANRLRPQSPSSQKQTQDLTQHKQNHETCDGVVGKLLPPRESLPPLSTKNKRLEKNITTVHDLLELNTLPIQNTDQEVEDVDDRIRRAQGKMRIIERTVGEVPAKTGSGDGFKGPVGKNENIEDASYINVGRLSARE